MGDLTAQTRVKAASPLSFTPVRSGLRQRKCACGGTPGLTGECAECREKRLRRRSTNLTEPSTAPPIVHEVLRSPGQLLDEATRAFMEPRFGHDFSKVRVHTDDRAAESARAVNALAYTVGRDIVFGAGRYAPASTEGTGLLAHELAHTAQQEDRGGWQSPISIGPPGDVYEVEAIRVADAVTAGNGSGGLSFTPDRPYLRRACYTKEAEVEAEVGKLGPCTGESGDVYGTEVRFVVNCDDVRPAMVLPLIWLLSTMSPEDKVRVHGYASNDGSPVFNEHLSCLRAHRVASWLTTEGVLLASKIEGLYMHGGTPGSFEERRSVIVEIVPRLPKPEPEPEGAKEAPSCPSVPTSTPSTCDQRHNTYCDAYRCFPNNPWLSCACVASGQVCQAVEAFKGTSRDGILLWICAAPTEQEILAGEEDSRGILFLKGTWLLDTNKCIWGHWRAALEAIHNPALPAPSTLTPEWKLAVDTCRSKGVSSSECCRAHVTAEQQAIDRCGPYDSSLFGSLPSDVPGSPICGRIVRENVPGPPFTGDFGKVADRIAYGNSRCCP